MMDTLELSLTSDKGYKTIEQVIAYHPRNTEGLWADLNAALSALETEFSGHLSAGEDSIIYSATNISYDFLSRNRKLGHQDDHFLVDLSYLITIDVIQKRIDLEFSPDTIPIPAVLTKEKMQTCKQSWEELRGVNRKIDQILQAYGIAHNLQYQSPFSYFLVPQEQQALPGISNGETPAIPPA